MDRVLRTIIFNQLEILKRMDPAGAKEYENKQRVVEAGYTSRYDEVFGSVQAEEASPEMQDEVWDTLAMFRALDRAKQKGWKPSNPDGAIFDGFDANNDSHYFFASYLIDKCGLFEEFSPNKNSHGMASVQRFRRMVRAWKALKNPRELTPEDAESVIAKA